MSDGLPSLAPQWLKSGSSSGLGAGTHGSTGGKGDNQKLGSSWRESGSRLGLGAGTDRESSSTTESKQTAGSRRQAASAQDRSKSFQGDKPLSYRQGNGRALSDRELVEQTSALKLRSGSWAPGEGLAQDSAYHISGSRRNGDRSFGSRSGYTRGGNRKAGGQPRSTPVHPMTPERDFASLGRITNVGSSAGPGGMNSKLRAGPPQSPTLVPEQAWTSSLADASAEVHVLPNAQGQEQPASAVGPAVGGEGKPTPRMADAILQAQESAAQEAAKAAKLRMEQLALRQSKQLVPVIAGPKAKHGANNAHGPSNTSLTLPKKSTGLEPLGRANLSTLSSTARRDEDALSGGKRTPPATAAPTSSRDNALSPRVPPGGAKPARERDRLAFFGSLRRKTSGGELLGSGDHSHLSSQSRAASDAASEAGQASPKTLDNLEVPNGGLSESAPSPAPPDLLTNAALDKGSLASHDILSEADLLPEMTPEEMAFMRSLGWEETVEEEGGLTEEEVAAFRARYPLEDVAATNAASSPVEALKHYKQPQGSKACT